LLLEYSSFRKELRNKNYRYRALTAVPLVTAKEGIERVLADDTVFVSYLFSETSIAGFALSKNEGLQIQFFSISDLTPSIQALRDALADGVSGEKTNRLARQLGDSLIKPFSSALTGKRRLIISPDGPLAFLPFEVLIHDGGRLVR
jgi:hypothetical protein